MNDSYSKHNSCFLPGNVSCDTIGNYFTICKRIWFCAVWEGYYVSNYEFSERIGVKTQFLRDFDRLLNAYQYSNWDISYSDIHVKISLSSVSYSPKRFSPSTVILQLSYNYTKHFLKQGHLKRKSSFPPYIPKANWKLLNVGSYVASN